eukprot:scaffold55404_cov14-Tisochrysis_lutea.AAC.1
MQCLGQQQELHTAAVPCSCMHPSTAECAPCKLLLPFIDDLLPLDNQQQTIHQRFPHPHTRAAHKGCRSCSTSRQQTSCSLQCPHLSTRDTHPTIVRT